MTKHTLRLNPGTFACRAARFTPRGEVSYYGDFSQVSRRTNPENWSSKDTLAARLFVGFSVNDEPTYTLDDLVELVGTLRREAGKPNASFMTQRGIYQHHDSRHIVQEDGAQVIIIDTWSTPVDDFREEMVKLAEIIAEQMQQEEVIVELQRNGISLEVIGVSA
jgi:hypothetical protein